MDAPVGYGLYISDSGCVVVEIPAPGREAEDVDVQVQDDDSVLIDIKPKEGPPGSLLCVGDTFTLVNAACWNLKAIKATCRNGLLKLEIPRMAQPTKARGFDWRDFILQQRPEWN